MVDYAEAFTLFDSNSDGVITKDELKAVMASIKMDAPDAKLDAMIKEANTSGSGSVTKDEFIAMMSRKVAGADSKDDIIAAFKVLADDNDDTGMVSVDDLKTTMEKVGLKLSPDEVTAMLKDAAADTADGKINYKTFAARFYEPIA
jgi:calmodulin